MGVNSSYLLNEEERIPQLDGALDEDEEFPVVAGRRR